MGCGYVAWGDESIESEKMYLRLFQWGKEKSTRGRFARKDQTYPKEFGTLVKCSCQFWHFDNFESSEIVNELVSRVDIDNDQIWVR